MTTTTWTVTGMTCDHCANAIVEEVSEVAGVEGVTVDRPTGRMTVDTSAAVADDAITDAVSEAGNYTASKRS